jgi:hypothetical protein
METARPLYKMPDDYVFVDHQYICVVVFVILCCHQNRMAVATADRSRSGSSATDLGPHGCTLMLTWARGLLSGCRRNSTVVEFGQCIGLVGRSRAASNVWSLEASGGSSHDGDDGDDGDTKKQFAYGQQSGFVCVWVHATVGTAVIKSITSTISL